MKIQFTQQQFKAVRQSAECPPELAQAFYAGVSDFGRTDKIVEAPYIAWVRLRGILLSRLHKPSGARVRSVPRSQGKATQKIVAAINAADRHPALKGVAMASMEADTFPVWELSPPDERGRVWSMYPIPGARFTVLLPHWEWAAGLTYWKPDDWSARGLSVSGSPLHVEQTHLRLIGL